MPDSSTYGAAACFYSWVKPHKTGIFILQDAHDEF